jgi:tRNA threonylcarbamoyl adenosine modification protein YeaZ
MARTFAPQIEQALRLTGWNPRQVNLFAVSEGPGSFTGLRIGVTAAKVFAYATGCEVLGVDTLEVMAAQVPLDGSCIWATLDAQRGQLYAESFTRSEGRWRSQTPPQIWDVEAWINQLRPGDVVTGPGLARCQTQIPSIVRVADPARWVPEAETLGHLAVDRFLAGGLQRGHVGFDEPFRNGPTLSATGRDEQDFQDALVDAEGDDGGLCRDCFRIVAHEWENLVSACREDQRGRK